MVTGPIQAPTALPSGKEARQPFSTRLGGPKAGRDTVKRQTISELHSLDSPVTVPTELPGCMVQMITQTLPCYKCNLTTPFKQIAFLVH
jgi:hypothetical protein